jgi:glycosyltransferase involved in cell wall biosynthesis
VPATGAPLVTVITIFHNAPVGFFEEAIASVLAQTEPRWELLLVDDGSTDASAAVARRAAAEHPDRIRVLTHPGGANRGMSASRTLGLAAATGEYVAFLDADDLFLPEKLEHQLAILEAHPEAAIVLGPSLHWWSWTGRPEDAQHDHPRRLGAPPGTVVPPPELVRAYLERRADTPATCAVLIRRSAITAVGGFEPRFRDLYEDQAFFYKLLLTHSAYVEGQAWDRYRRHPAAACEVRIRTGEHADDYTPTEPRRVFLEWLDRYLAEAPTTDPRLIRLLRRELLPFRHPVRHRAAGQLRAAARALVPAGARRALRRQPRPDRPGRG